MQEKGEKIGSEGTQFKPMSLFNVSRMLVNLTPLRSKVKNYAKYDITHTETGFMIFTQTTDWATHKTEFKLATLGKTREFLGGRIKEMLLYT